VRRRRFSVSLRNRVAAVLLDLVAPADRADELPTRLVFEKALRPGQRFLLRLRIVDEGSNAQAVLTRRNLRWRNG